MKMMGLLNFAASISLGRVACLAAVFLIALGITAAQATPIFNEIRISSAADDDFSNFFELAGVSGESLDGLTVLVVSAEFNPGSINSATDLTGTSVPADGFYLGSTDLTFYGAQTDIATGVDYFGSPGTFLLVDGFTGSAGDDLDTDDDGVLDTTPWTSIIDSVAMVDGDANADFPLSATVVGPDGAFAPAHIFRDVDAAGTFQIGNFSDLSADTPGASNVPEPASLVLLFAGLLGLGAVRRK